MAQTFQLRIQDLVGEAVSEDLSLSVNMLQDLFDDGMYEIIGRLPTEALRLTAIVTSDFAPDTGSAIENARIMDVLRSDGTVKRPCEKIPYELAGLYAEKGSYYDSSIAWPVYYEEPQTSGAMKIKILPSSSDSIGTIVYAKAPSTTISSATAITGWPDELENLPVWWAVSQVFIRETAFMRRKAQDEIEAITSGTLSNLTSLYTEVDLALNASKTEIAKMDNEIDTASSSISTDSDIEQGRAELGVATSRAGNAAEYVRDAGARLSEIQSYLTESATRTQTAADYIVRGKDALAQHNVMAQKFENRLEKYIARFTRTELEEA